MSSVERQAERVARQRRAYERVVIDGASLKDVAPELGVSRQTVAQDVAIMRQALGADGAADLEAKRIQFLDRVNDLYDKALATYERFKDTKPMAAVGALNTAVTMLTHLRAVQGLDAPKEVRADVDGNITIQWADEALPTGEQ